MLTFYGYPKCSTCRNARKWLDSHGVKYTGIDITEKPPSAALLKQILKAGDYTLRNLFNTSGRLYREMKIKDKLANMSEPDAVKLLAAHGKLCKRPIVTDGKMHTVGFNESTFKQAWG